jgi:hypothetical protein
LIYCPPGAASCKTYTSGIRTPEAFAQFYKEDHNRSKDTKKIPHMDLKEFVPKSIIQSVTEYIGMAPAQKEEVVDISVPQDPILRKIIESERAQSVNQDDAIPGLHKYDDPEENEDEHDV